ncbi:NupC/NupG family nucleoside CNT transporter [Aeriscardovia aeriphila]|uniref:Nucleoside transporter n=1 Tax=Aeriscardovia aeriphila TaxID=218139 RepID=A0A261FAQ4_9BIFI|nr:nucleoside transporter C-terminal domain-containing protein [Aeriscardovia aeriphila]NYI25612.1 purine nucleoside transport protein [Aeriscardovia aeriphila]OZG56240.1 nucleoside transporter [Aeriscardovia aeriphila]
MYLALNVLGILVFVGIGWLFSHDKKHIQWLSVGIMMVFNIFIAWFLTSFSVGRSIVQGAATGFNELVKVAYKGINFAFANWVGPEGINPAPVNFIASALLPILLVVPMFDILTYIGVLPWIIKWIGRGLSFITRQPKFESFFAVEMMFLGNTEALAVSQLQLKRMKPARNLTLAMMSMSCVTASILASYIQLVPAQYVLTAVPLNCINALIVVNLLYPVHVDEAEDTIATLADTQAVESVQTAATEVQPAATEEVQPAVAEKSPAADEEEKPVENKSSAQQKPVEKPQREPFFSFLGDSILGAGRLILIIGANVIAFVALAALIDKVLSLINPQLTLAHILGVFLYIPSLLLGLDPSTAWDMAGFMGMKLVTNEFVVMTQITSTVASFAQHYQAVLIVFITSFANFSTVGMVTGCFKGLVDKEKNDLIARNVGRLILSGILVSLLSAGMVGLFVW